MYFMNNIIMKKAMLIFLLLFFSACQIQPEQKCDLSYSFVNGACCLDKDVNRICDRDETPKVQAIVGSKDVLFVQEMCNIPHFTCLYKKITAEKVVLDVRLERDETIHVQKISLPELKCSQTFNSTLKFGEEEEFTIPCVITGALVKSSIVTDANIQEVLRHSNGQIYDYGTVTPTSLRGEIAGVVS